jgi:hypothetical protein
MDKSIMSRIYDEVKHIIYSIHSLIVNVNRRNPSLAIRDGNSLGLTFDQRIACPALVGLLLRDNHFKPGGGCLPVPGASPSPVARLPLYGRLFDVQRLHGSNRAKRNPDGCERPSLEHRRNAAVASKLNHQGQSKHIVMLRIVKAFHTSIIGKYIQTPTRGKYLFSHPSHNAAYI